MSDTLEQPCELKEVATYTTAAAASAMSEHKTESCEVINCYECCQKEWRGMQAERDALRERAEKAETETANFSKQNLEWAKCCGEWKEQAEKAQAACAVGVMLANYVMDFNDIICNSPGHFNTLTTLAREVRDTNPGSHLLAKLAVAERLFKESRRHDINCSDDRDSALEAALDDYEDLSEPQQSYTERPVRHNVPSSINVRESIAEGGKKKA